VGGYELRCALAAEKLRTVGHDVLVLTSSYGLGQATHVHSELVEGVSVDRSLFHHRLGAVEPKRFYTATKARRQLSDVRRFLQVLREFRPDIVNWWNLEGLTKSILGIPPAHGIPDIHWVEDLWLVREYGAAGENEKLSWFDFWAGRWGPRLVRPALRRALSAWANRLEVEGIPTRPFPNRPRHVCFVSEFMRFAHQSAGLNFSSSEVILGGICTDRFYRQRSGANGTRSLRLLYAGQLTVDRGLHT